MYHVLCAFFLKDWAIKYMRAAGSTPDNSTPLVQVLYMSDEPPSLCREGKIGVRYTALLCTDRTRLEP